MGISGATGICPNLEDPVRTLFQNGTSIDTGVLGPLLENKLLIVLSVLIAIAVVVGGLFVLVMSRQVSLQASKGMRQRRARKERTQRD